MTIAKRWWFTYARGKNLQNWASIYALPDSELHAFYEDNITSHRQFLDRVSSEANGGTILEAGCGSSTLSIHLSTRGHGHVVAVDADDTVLQSAQRYNALLGGQVAYTRADIRQLPFRDGEFGVAFSQGVLEHFSDREIRQMVREQLRVAKCVLVSVPSRFYRARDLGNERLLTVDEWKTILREFDVIRGEYYCSLRKAKNLYLRRPMMLMLHIDNGAGSRSGDNCSR